MKLSEFIHLLQQLPEMEVCQAIGPSSSHWGELNLMDEDNVLQCYIGSNPQYPTETALIFYDHYVTDSQTTKGWIPLKAYTTDIIEHWQNVSSKIEAAIIETLMEVKVNDS